MSVLKGWEEGEIGENYAPMLTESKNGSREEAKKKGSRNRECKAREAGGLDPVKKARNKHLNSSLSFRQAALTFCLPGATSCLT